ncbi:MAG: hypothetical protein JST11_09200 [Acidobacteria bacterium]|nr:hypothetical protein [Acidobacteriota bacterium]
MPTACRVAFVTALAGMLGAAPPLRMVTADVAAYDAKGRFVADLRAEELRVMDAGRQQEITFFRRGNTIPHAVAVLIDQLNGDLEQRSTEWNRTVRALATVESEWDAFVYVLTPSGALYPVRPMPDSWAGWTPPAISWEAVTLPALESVKSAYQGWHEYKDKVETRAEATAWAIEELRVRLAAVPGHAAVVWAGPMGRGKAETSMPHSARSTGGAAIEGVPLYIAGSPSAIGAAAGKVLCCTPSTARILPHSDVREVIPRASAEAQQYYRVGWLPGAENWDGKPHTLKVTCRRPGVRIVAREKYQAPRLVDVSDDQRQEMPDLLPLIAFDSSQIRLAAAVAASTLTLRVDPSDFVAPDGTARFAVGVMEAAPGETRALIGGARSMELEVTGQPVAIPLDLGEQAPADLRVIVLDRVSGAFGTRTVRRSP